MITVKTNLFFSSYNKIPVVLLVHGPLRPIPFANLKCHYIFYDIFCTFKSVRVETNSYSAHTAWMSFQPEDQH